MKVLLLRILVTEVAGLGGLVECQCCGTVGATPSSIRHRNCLWGGPEGLRRASVPFRAEIFFLLILLRHIDNRQIYRVRATQDETRFACCTNHRFVAAVRSASSKALVIEIITVIYNRSRRPHCFG